MPRVVHITTIPESLTFLRGQPRYLKARGYDFAAIASPGGALGRFGSAEGIPVFPVQMPRKITPFRDLGAVCRLAWIMRDFSADIVHAHTPKGGLLGMLAARAVSVPVRIYHMRGLPFVTARGLKRTLLQFTERVSCALASQVICQSPSLRETALQFGLCPANKAIVLGMGSNGVDAEKCFNPAAWSTEQRRAGRMALGMKESSTVIGYVGRIVRDKGITELVEAWRTIRDRHPDARLLVVGPFEDGDRIDAHTRKELESDPRIHLTGVTPDPASLYALMDVVALPSYREGFPNVPLEAAAMGLPVVATRIPGCVDAVADGETGELVPAMDSESLSVALSRYVEHPELRARHGAAGRARVLREFTRERIHALTLEAYERLCEEALPEIRRPTPRRGSVDVAPTDPLDGEANLVADDAPGNPKYGGGNRRHAGQPTTSVTSR